MPSGKLPTCARSRRRSASSRHPFLRGPCAAGALLAALLTLATPSGADPTALIDRVGTALEQQLARASDAGIAADRPSGDGGPLERFYAERGFRPAWIDATGPNGRATAVLAAFERAADEGLDPADYGRPAAALRTAAGPLPEDLARLELSLSRTLIRFARDLRTGRLDPRAVDAGLPDRRAEVDDAEFLRRAAAASDVRRFLAELAPASPPYRRLREALARHRAIEARGGWPELAPGANLERGARDERVFTLRRRLEITGELAASGPGDDRFDAALDEAVRAFQRRHGLGVDGVVGPQTRAALTVPVADRIGQVVANMERWRRMPEDLGRRPILVNVPAFDLKVVEDGATVLAMAVVVGRPSRPTPVFSAPLTAVEINPYWHVPRSIAVRDILPQARQDPRYLVERGIRVFLGHGDDAVELNPLEVDWGSLGPRDFPFLLRQDPGPRNALGRIKFMLASAHGVLLHDTPDRHLFERRVRAASSGCIRLAEPIALAAYLLRADPRLEGGLRGAIASGRTRGLRLEEPIPVHLIYLTAWVDDNGTVHFRDDLYGHDERLTRALSAVRAAAPHPAARESPSCPVNPILVGDRDF